MHVVLVHLGDHLLQAEVVGLSHEQGDEAVQLVVFLHGHPFVLRGVGDHHGVAHLVEMVGAEGYGLQPHHAAEVALQFLRAGVVATWAEEAIGEHDVVIVLHELAEIVGGGHHALHLLAGLGVVGLGADIAAGEELVGHVEEDGVVEGTLAQRLIVARPFLPTRHGAVHDLREVGHQAQQPLLLDLAQHAVDVEVIELQVEVGGHEVGEL